MQGYPICLLYIYYRNLTQYGYILHQCQFPIYQRGQTVQGTLFVSQISTTGDEQYWLGNVGDQYCMIQRCVQNYTVEERLKCDTLFASYREQIANPYTICPLYSTGKGAQTAQFFLSNAITNISGLLVWHQYVRTYGWPSQWVLQNQVMNNL